MKQIIDNVSTVINAMEKKNENRVEGRPHLEVDI